MNNKSTAKDLMEYYFGMTQLRILFSYDEYDMLCSKYISKNDRGYQELIKSMIKLVSTQE